MRGPRGSPPLLDGQQPSVVRQRMDEDGGVFTRLDDLVEVADRAISDRAGQGAIDPDGGISLQQIAPHQVAGGQIFMTRDGDEGSPRG